MISGQSTQAFDPAIDDVPIREGGATEVARRQGLAPAACSLAKASGQA
jgi:hypothetical protein